ncbi:hypothetical protein PINS_up006908 [Pythium insidiosum]|nr:hypothetical protein PINS_up006908 [Pythium insidiosum]
MLSQLISFLVGALVGMTALHYYRAQRLPTCRSRHTKQPATADAMPESATFAPHPYASTGAPITITRA